MENTQTQIDYPRGITFEQVWTSLQETGRLIKESQKETDKQLQETDKQLKELGKRFGDFTNRFGEVVEYMVAPNLQDKFYEMGMDFQEVCPNYKVNSKKSGIRFQVDVFLQNGDTAMLVEIKTKLTISDINEHIKRLEKMRMFADLHRDSEPKVRRVFLGAVAGVVVESDEREYALKNGFYLIEPSGETFNITPPDKHKEW